MMSVTPIDVHALARRGVDSAHGVYRLRHDLAALDGHALGRGRQLVGLAGVVGVLLDGRSEFFH